MQQTIQDFLGHSPFIRADARLDLGAQRSVTIWENCDSRIQYDAPEGHVFSLYLRGGQGTRRLDAGGITGWPGAICLMPEGHRSDWEITSPFRFAHLYMPDTQLRATYAMTHDCDARRMELPDLSFVDLPGFALPLRELASAASEGDILRADTALAELVGQLHSRRVTLQGGLSRYILRRIDEWIDAHLDENIRLSDMAETAGLSEYHFHRMFRHSRGMPPHSWITTRRIDRAKTLLRTATPLAEIAVACGFSSQSHLSRVFRNQTGHTLGEYRKAVR